METSTIIATNDNINPEPDNNSPADHFQNCENESIRYWQDSHQLLSLLPKEVWDHICSFLENRDFLNLINCSLFFRELLLRKRVLLLYQPVLQILIPKLKEYLETPTTNYQEDVRGVLLESRETCKAWKRTIDQQACISDAEDFKLRNLTRYILSKNFTFKDSWEIDTFLQNFNTTHPSHLNPSPGKYIDLHIRLMEPDYPQLINRISTLLEKYGRHLNTLELSIMFGHQNPLEFHQKMVEWLNCVPNLQTLLIFCFVPLRFDLEEQVQLELLPRQLNSLKNLAIETFVPPLADDHIPNSSWMDSYNFSKIIHQHDNLEFLKITMFNKNDFRILESVTSPLKKLVALYHCKEDEVSLSEVFSMLSEKFSDSLENLRIMFRVSYNSRGHLQLMRDLFNGRLNLPKVKKFEIKMLRMYGLDFLLGMKENLEELIINCVGGRWGHIEYSDFSEVEQGEIGLIKSGQIIDFLGYQSKMLESNIWRMFPKLKVIWLTGSDERTELKREDWRKIQEQI